MSRNILHILGRLTVDIARQVEVELVLLDLLEGDHLRIFIDLQPLVEDIHDLVNILGAQAVLGTILDETAAGVDHENSVGARYIAPLLVNDDDAGGNARAVE